MNPVILAFTLYYLPGYRAGGPIRSIANMVERLGSDFDFRIVAMDRDMGDSRPYEGVELDRWNAVGQAMVFYASSSSRSLRGLARLMSETPHDVVYLNSFFDPVFTLRHLLVRRVGLVPSKPLVIAPRGEFFSGALQLKRWKKACYLGLMRILGLYRGATWQASSDLEAVEIHRILKTPRSRNRGNRVIVATDLAAAKVHEDDQQARLARDRTEPLRVCFLSRISPIKNLDYALRVLAQVRRPVRFSIYGPREVLAYWEKCQRLMASLPPNTEVEYRGRVDHESVVQTLAGHDLFFLPTQGENYGHVIHEALRAGMPVLISDRTPWGDIEKRGIGWALPLDDPSGFVRVIEQVADWDADTAWAVAERARAFAAQVGTDTGALEANVTLFRCALASANR